jgi:hypothetical protein
MRHTEDRGDILGGMLGFFRAKVVRVVRMVA